MPAAPLTIVAVALYLAVAAACIRAAAAALHRSRRLYEVLHWAAIALFFGAVSALRVLGVEEGVRTKLREQLVANREYLDRWEFQAPVTALAFLVLAIAVAAMLFLHPARRPPPKQRSRLMHCRWMADMAVAAMSGLILLRVISLHSVDYLLYHSVHLNWLVDIGSTAVALYAAVRYSQLLRGTRR